MVEDFKQAIMEKPIVSVTFVIVGVVIGYFVGPMIKKLFKKGGSW